MIVVAPVCFFSSHKKPKRNATKNKNKMPQKAKTECHKKQNGYAYSNIILYLCSRIPNISYT